MLGNIQVVLVGLLAWLFLGERPENRTLVAIPVVFGGVVLISGVVGSGAYGEDPVLGVVFGVLTAITYALFILILRQGNADDRRPAGPLFDATLSGAVFSALGRASPSATSTGRPASSRRRGSCSSPCRPRCSAGS